MRNTSNTTLAFKLKHTHWTLLQLLTATSAKLFISFQSALDASFAGFLWHFHNQLSWKESAVWEMSNVFFPQTWWAPKPKTELTSEPSFPVFNIAANLWDSTTSGGREWTGKSKCVGLNSLTVNQTPKDALTFWMHWHRWHLFAQIHKSYTPHLHVPVLLLKRGTVVCRSVLLLLAGNGVWNEEWKKNSAFASHRDFLHPTRPSSCRIFRVPQSSFCPWRRGRQLS